MTKSALKKKNTKVDTYGRGTVYTHAAYPRSSFGRYKNRRQVFLDLVQKHHLHDRFYLRRMVAKLGSMKASKDQLFALLLTATILLPDIYCIQTGTKLLGDCDVRRVLRVTMSGDGAPQYHDDFRRRVQSNIATTGDALWVIREMYDAAKRIYGSRIVGLLEFVETTPV